MMIDARSISLATILLGLLLGSLAAACAAQVGQSNSNQGPLLLHVSGSKIVNSKGQVVRLQGLDVPSMEWSNTGDPHLMDAVQTAIVAWHSNVIRLPLCQDRWFGKAPGQDDGGKTYRRIVDDVVKSVAGLNCYVILDLHWSDAGQWGKNIGQHKMPDPNSVKFWRSAAKRYANEPAVLFDLYNEPHDVTWPIWRNGGQVTEKLKSSEELSYEAPGLQQLLEVVRSAGAKNVVIAGGLNWAYDLRGILNGYALSDPKGNGVIYDTHIYPWKSDWQANAGCLTGKYPVIVGEVGAYNDPKYESPYKWAPRVLQFIEKNEWSWTAWCFHPSAGTIIADWNYTPTPYWGVFVKEALAGKLK